MRGVLLWISDLWTDSIGERFLTFPMLQPFIIPFLMSW